MIFIIISFILGLSIGSIIGVYAVTSSICIDMLSEKDFDRLKKAVKKRGGK